MKAFQNTFVKAIILVLFFLKSFYGFSQYCDSITPSTAVDLTASPNMSWTSLPIIRNGNCCGTSNPDRCLEFIITLHPDAIAVNFTISSGAVPPGALFYQIDCGPVTPVGSPICLSGPGPHNLTFCKPGNNENTFSITSYSSPIIGPDISLFAGCQGFIYGEYYDESTVSWTSIAPGASGTYDSYLSCAAGCDTTYVTAPNSGAPAFVDYLVCGDDVGGCNVDPICDTIRVTFVPPHVLTVTPSLTTICAGDPPVLLTASVAGGSGSFTYLWSTGATTPTILAGAGVHSVTVTDMGGCAAVIGSAAVNALPLPLVNGGADQSVCIGTAVTLSGAGATNYVWDNGITNGVAFVPVVGTTTYTVTGTDANGCVNTDQVNVTVNPLPIVSAGADQVVCIGTAVILNGAGATSYVWDNGITNAVAFVPAVGTMTYTVTGTDANGCVNTDQVNVTVNPLPIVSAGLDQTVCEGAAVTLNGSGATSYVWNNGITNGVAFVPAVGTITYTVTGTDANGCINTDQVNVTVNPLPIVNAGADQTACEGTAVTLNGSGATSYIWTNGVTNGVAFVQAVGTVTYTVTGTDANACSNSDQVVVVVNPLPIVSAGPDQTVCVGTAVILNGSGATSYVWDNGITNGVAFVPVVGTMTYTVTGTDANGCVNTDQVNVTVNPLPIVSAGLDQTVCEGTAVNLNGSGAISYVWNNGITNGLTFAPAAGTITYTVTGTDANGCINTDQVNVTVNPLPIVGAGTDQTVCVGTAVTLNGAGATSYVWNNGITNGVAFLQAVGTMTYTVTGTDANGCVNTDQVNVTVNPLPIVNAGLDQMVCVGTAVTLNGSGATSYVWDNGITNGVAFVPAVGTMTYTITGTDANGCVNTDQVNVTVNPLPIVNAGLDQTVCEGTAVTLNGSGATSYVWDNGITNGVAFVPAVGTMTYTVTGTDANSCVNTDQVNVTVNSLPIVNAGADQTVCEGTAVTLNGSGATNYSWNNGITNGVAFVQAVGTMTYTITGTDIHSCSNSDQVVVVVNPLPTVDAGADQTVCEGTPITFSAVGTPNLVWDNGVVNNVPFTQAAGTIVYTLTDSFATGCSALDQVLVTVYPNPIVTAEDKQICAGEGVTLSGSGAIWYSWTGGVLDGVEFFPTQTSDYTVTGTNNFGCSATALAKVTVHALPSADFKILDLSLTTISSGTGFENLSIGATTYDWNFGDGSANSNEFEPFHEFPNEEAGSYEVTLIVTSPEGCIDDRVKYVYVSQDYTIYVPNAFTPDGNGANEVFKPVMEGFDENDYVLYIFNRWGELVFESHDMSVGWDGEYSQLDENVQDGVFTWKIIAGFKDSGDSKIFVGHVSLLK